MKKRTKILAAALVFVLLLCLLPATALADPSSEATQPATATPVPEASPEPMTVEPESAAAALPDGTQAVYNEADQTLYAQAGSVTYNNGGTVYNNGGTVYNNAGLVYNNGGLVYNNAGTVYSNGGTVYNNAGKVFNNGAAVYVNDGDVEDSVVYGYYKVTMAADYSAFADFSGLDTEPVSGGLLIRREGECTISPKAGYTISAASSSSGRCSVGSDGVCTLSAVEADVTLTLSFKADAPVFSLAAGTYNKAQTVAISAAEGADIYYTLDGTTPTTESEKYTQPIQVTEGFMIKAIAAAEGAETSARAEAAYAVPKITAPVFEAVSEGYALPDAQPIVVENSGSADARIQSFILSGDNADSFYLSRTSGGKVSAGTTDSISWTIQPKIELKAGTYSAVVTLTFDTGDLVEVMLSFTVK